MHDATAAVGEVDDAGGERIPVRIVGLSAANPTALLDRDPLRLDRLPAFEVERGILAALGPYSDVDRVLQQFRLAVGVSIGIGQFARSVRSDTAVPTLRPFSILLDARDDRVCAQVPNRVGMPFSWHTMSGAMVTALAACIGRRDPEFVEFPRDPFVAVAIFAPVQNHQPDADLVGILGEELHVVAFPANVLAVLKPLDGSAVGADERPAEAVGCPPARAEALACHHPLDEDDSITQPWRKFSVLPILEYCPDKVGVLIGLHFFGRVRVVVGNERYAAKDQVSLEQQHARYVLRSGQPVPLEDIHVGNGPVSLGVMKKLQKPRPSHVTTTNGIVQVDVLEVVQSPALHLLNVGDRAAETHADLDRRRASPFQLLAEGGLLAIVAPPYVDQGPPGSLCWSGHDALPSTLVGAVLWASMLRVSQRKSASASARSSASSATRT